MSLDSPHFVSDFQSKSFELKVHNTGSLYGRETVSSLVYRGHDLVVVERTSLVEVTVIKFSRPTSQSEKTLLLRGHVAGTCLLAATYFRGQAT